MKELILFTWLNILAFVGFTLPDKSPSTMQHDKDVIKISQDLLFAVKTGDTTGNLLAEVKDITEAMLTYQLINDDLKKVF